MVPLPNLQVQKDLQDRPMDQNSSVTDQPLPFLQFHSVVVLEVAEKVLVVMDLVVLQVVLVHQTKVFDSLNRHSQKNHFVGILLDVVVFDSE